MEGTGEKEMSIRGKLWVGHHASLWHLVEVRGLMEPGLLPTPELSSWPSPSLARIRQWVWEASPDSTHLN